MAELRWVLLGLGVLVVVSIYLWGRGIFGRNRVRARTIRRRAEPHISSAPEFNDDQMLAPAVDQAAREAWADAEPSGSEASGRDASEQDAFGQGASSPEAAPAAEERPSLPEKIITVRFIPKEGEIGGEEAVQALREAGLEHGRYGIFHLHDEGGSGEAQFSVASLTEPGSFDLTQLAANPIAGMSFFMVLPGTGDPVTRFDAMVQTARVLAVKLDAELFDDRGSSWSIQRERYVREEIIRYRHQLMQTEVVGDARV